MEGEEVARVTRGLGSWERELGWGTGKEEEKSVERREGSHSSKTSSPAPQLQGV